VVTCNVDAAKGTLTVPASLLSGFTASGSFVAGVSSSATKNVGDWLTEFEAVPADWRGFCEFANYRNEA